MFDSDLVSVLGGIIAEAMKDQKTFDEADRLYQQVFRDSEVVKGADILASGDQSYIDYMLEYYVCVDVYDSEEEAEFHSLNERGIDHWFEPEIIQAAPAREEGLKLLESMEFYETCNYKGEGEGFVVRTPLTDKLPVFYGKYNYSGF